MAEDALGAHIERGARARSDRGRQDGVFAGERSVGEAEVDEDELAELVKADVAGGEVAVEDAVVPGVEERLVDLDGGEHGVIEGEGADAGEEVVQVFAADVRHDEIVEAIDLADVEDGGDIGVTGEAGSEEAFAAEAGEELRLFGEGGVEDFDGEEAVVDAVADEVDAGHAADADDLQHEVAGGEEDGEAGGYIPRVGLGLKGDVRLALGRWRGEDAENAAHERRRLTGAAGAQESAWTGVKGVTGRGRWSRTPGCWYQRRASSCMTCSGSGLRRAQLKTRWSWARVCSRVVVMRWRVQRQTKPVSGWTLGWKTGLSR